MATHSSILAWTIPWKESLVGYSPKGVKESDTTEQLNTHHKYYYLYLSSENKERNLLL